MKPFSRYISNHFSCCLYLDISYLFGKSVNRPIAYFKIEHLKLIDYFLVVNISYTSVIISHLLKALSAYAYVKQRYYKLVIENMEIDLSHEIKTEWPSRLGLQNTLTASLQKVKILPTSVLIYDTKESDTQVLVMLRLWGMQSAPFTAVVLRSTLDRSGSTW